MVFLEWIEKKVYLDVVKDIVKEVERTYQVNLNGTVSTPLAEDLIDLTDDRLAKYIQVDPEGQYLK